MAQTMEAQPVYGTVLTTHPAQYAQGPVLVQQQHLQYSQAPPVAQVAKVSLQQVGGTAFVQQQPQQQQPPQQPHNADPRLHAIGITGPVTYEQEKYAGMTTILIGIFVFPCACLCPCDERTVVTELSTGRKVHL